MRCLGGAIVWFMIILTELALCALGGYCFYLRVKRFTPNDQPIYKYLPIAAYVLWGIAGVILIATCCCCNAIRLGIAVMKATAKFIADNLRIFILPFISYVLVTIWICLWFVGALYMYTVGYAAPRKGFEFSTEIFWDKYTKPIIVYYILGAFWLTAFIIGCTQFVIAAAAVMWYFD